jgi:hypothetical protein
MVKYRKSQTISPQGRKPEAVNITLIRLFPATPRRSAVQPVLALYPDAANPRGVKKMNFKTPVRTKTIHKTAPIRAGTGETLEDTRAEFSGDKIAAIRPQREAGQ